MPAGSLRERVVLRKPQPTLDLVGDQVEGWVDVATVWARVQAMSGQRDVEQVMRDENVMRWRVTIRYRGDVSPGWLALWRSRRLRVDAALPSERREWLTMECTEVLNA